MDNSSSGGSGVRTHHRQNGGFENPWPSFSKREVAKGQSPALSIISTMKREPSKADLAALLLLSGKPDFQAAESHLKETRSSVVVSWLGHCTFLIQVHGATFLTDPVWGGKSSPVMHIPGAHSKRIVPPPCEISELPCIDAILITSSRSDHLDKSAVRDIRTCQPSAKWFVPLQVGSLLAAAGVPSENIVELDWYQNRTLDRDVEVVCTPSQFVPGGPWGHHSTSLWCSWVVLGPRSRIFFAGGTGYRAVNKETPCDSREEREKFPACPAFREIGQRYGPFSVAFLPIGGYSPRSLLSSIQCDPLDAIAIHLDVRARQSVAMNWGTLQHMDEETLEPLRKLERSLIDCKLSDSDFVVMMPGKTRVFH
uniref:Metallo-beta-lactamase domain-containing protein n=1 Tax=Compsopogon caeruleus TaxID=31354 RepID=A0A7S1XEJ7_9RHOD|mmetsp:Transcript_3750/g.7162  ORF Transcript_3750/g.7162 Transcript_3750/m.7162 type:complete len:367 (+) Transcript_3750:124-1224(+)